jgi:hypothetical protein
MRSDADAKTSLIFSASLLGFSLSLSVGGVSEESQATLRQRLLTCRSRIWHRKRNAMPARSVEAIRTTALC